MHNIYVVPHPPSTSADHAISFFRLEEADGSRVRGSQHEYKTLAGAIADATRIRKDAVFIASVRNPSKANPDHWRAA